MTAQHEAYVWRRQLSYDQLSKIERVRRLRKRLDPATVEFAAFARCQLQDSDRWHNVGHSFSGIWEGREVRFEPTLRPLFMDYAIKVYSQALRDAVAYYPHFTRHAVMDGPLVGERRLVFPDQLDEAAAYWIRSRFYQLAEKGEITVSESFTAHVENSGTGATQLGDIVVDVVLDRERTDASTWEEVAAIVAAGKPFPIDPQPRKGDMQLACEMLAELSLPELVALNWDRVKKPLSDADRRLFAAIEAFDLNAAKAALDAGADPNAVSEQGDETALHAVVDFRWIDRHQNTPDNPKDWIQLDKELGPDADEVIRWIDLLISYEAAVDWASYDELTPLAEACLNSDAEVITHLLQYGADPSIRCYADDLPSEWGPAWEFADYRCNPIVDNDDESAWNALLAKWPKPWGRHSD